MKKKNIEDRMTYSSNLGLRVVEKSSETDKKSKEKNDKK